MAILFADIEAKMDGQASMTEGSKGFGGFPGLIGTRVREAAASQHREFFVGLTTKKERRFGLQTTRVTPLPNNPGNPPNPFEPSVIDA